MIVSLMTAVFLVVESESRWLSIVVILIGCSTPWLVLGYKVLFFRMLSLGTIDLHVFSQEALAQFES